MVWRKCRDLTCACFVRCDVAVGSWLRSGYALALLSVEVRASVVSRARRRQVVVSLWVSEAGGRCWSGPYTNSQVSSVLTQGRSTASMYQSTRGQVPLHRCHCYPCLAATRLRLRCSAPLIGYGTSCAQCVNVFCSVRREETTFTSLCDCCAANTHAILK